MTDREALLLEIVQAALRMRLRQRAYFKDRSKDNLIAAKQAEAEFDHLALRDQGCSRLPPYA